MSDQVFRRVGRGGAGNWYSEKDVKEAEKALAAAVDLEAQKHTDPAPGPSDGPAYARAGRGGAGNFKEKDAAVASIEAERAEVERTRAAVAATSAGKPRTTAMTGRGGAGNYTDGSAPAPSAAEQEHQQQKVEDLEMKVLKDVDSVLAAPPAAHKAAGKEEL
ncbi:hypothetical protein B0T18DRAFT_396576 [Schizothecium vesticola]|uniref:Uncharacterized protein n=1 Tax=Schizothecium vesticola TaxID=314040 RepID=A0AA40F8U2_9PEZI|nr:hypothetical protein B0T18DRAFT_396576 [Schizothecium vesticola]